MKIAVNNNIINKTNKPTAHGWHNEDVDLKSYAKIVQAGFAHSPGVLKNSASGKKPTKADVDYAEFLVIDVDNDTQPIKQDKRKKTDAEGYVSFNHIKQDKKLHEKLFLAYTTPSHSPLHHKFRLVFKLPAPVQAEEYTKIAKAANDIYGGDRACSNIDRMFFGYTNAEIIAIGNALTNADVQNIINHKQIELQADQDYQALNINGSLTEDAVRNMLRYIPAKLEYTQWLKVVSGVANYFDDLSIAERLIDEWAPDTKRGTAWRINNRLEQVKIGSVIWLAEQYGYDKSELKPFQKSNKKAKADRKSHKTIADTEGRLGKKKGKPSVQEVKEFLNDNYEFRFNVIKSYVEMRNIGDKEYIILDDRQENTIWTKLDDEGINIPIGDLQKILNSNYVKEYDPIKEYFDNLPEWDGDDYIEQFAKLIEVESDQKDYWKEYFTKWVVCAVAQAMGAKRKDGRGRVINHVCPVLAGKQGVGKTTIITRLVPPQLIDYFANAQINPNDKDSKILVTENFIINLDELESSSREEVATLKSLMTTEQITIRKPYARRAEVFKRISSFIGSVNRAHFLTDMTGARRFLPVDVVNIDLDKEIDVDQLYAQAKFMFLDSVDPNTESNFKYWFTSEEVDIINERNKRYQIVSPEEETLLKYFRPMEDVDQYTVPELRSREARGLIQLKTNTEILDFLNSKTSVKLSGHRLGQILKNSGFYQKSIKTKGRTDRLYVLQNIGADNNADF